MNRNEEQYLDLVRDVLTLGEVRDDRTGVGTQSLFGTQSRYDLRQGFPLLTTKRMDGKRWEGIVRELLWFLSGSTNCRELEQYGIPIWSAWAYDNGELGPIYGKQWRAWDAHSEATVNQDGEVLYRRYSIDQIENLIDGLKNNPSSRRHIVSAWNVADIDNMTLPCCHMSFQCYVTQDGYLDMQMYQRSADVALGVPYNIASYSLLLMMLGQVCEYTPRFLVHTVGDAHIYLNHIAGLQEQLKREPYDAPRVDIVSGTRNIDEFVYEDFVLGQYKFHPGIKFEVAV